jgi:hypothetical protein
MMFTFVCFLLADFSIDSIDFTSFAGNHISEESGSIIVFRHSSWDVVEGDLIPHAVTISQGINGLETKTSVNVSSHGFYGNCWRPFPVRAIGKSTTTRYSGWLEGARETCLKFAHPEILVIRRKVFTLRFNVLFDNLIGHIARTRGKVAARPEMLSPELFPPFAKLGQHLATAPPFQALHQAAHRHVRRYGDKEMMWSGAMWPFSR